MTHDSASERSELRTVVRDFLAATWSRDQLRAGLDGVRPDVALVWKRFAEELGLAGLVLPEAAGGAGATLSEAGVVLEELGRSLAPLPFLSHTVAAELLAAAGAGTDLLESVASGQRRATVVTSWDGPLSLTATATADGVELAGEVDGVPDGLGADLFVVEVPLPDGPALALLTANAPGVEVIDTSDLDPSLPRARVTLTSSPATLLPGATEEHLTHALAVARTGLAAILLGTARAALEQTVAQSMERSQFGRLIGSYQAIKHRLADMMVEVETTASAVSRAIDAIITESADASHSADLALTWAVEKTTHLVDEMIQLHGGMGYTWEHDAHLYYRRIHAARGLLGAGDGARDRAWASLAESLTSSAPEQEDDTATSSGADVAAEVQDFIDRQWEPGLTVREWWQRMAAERLNLPSLPEELGGRGWTSADEGVLAETMTSAGVTLGPGGIGRALAAPTIAAAGTAEQKARFLPGILDGTEAWCQLFSEPGAGSDLAGLRTKAVRDGDVWRITGQKTWTSNAHLADFAILLARTDADVPKHQGITYFLFPMRQEGVEIRPIREMNGHSMFNDVFLDGAVVPDEYRLGKLGDGWKLANLTLSVERSSIAASPTMTPAMPGEIAGHLERPAAEFVEAFDPHSLGVVTDESVATLLRLAEDRGADDVGVRRDLVRLAHMSQIRVESMRRAKVGLDVTGAEPNIGKLHSNAALRLARDLAVRILGPSTARAPQSADETWARELLLYTPAPAIYGGTDEIQRNIIAERALGLPRESDPSRTVAFRDIPTTTAQH
ncbi:acyl-CoA dehydrogenase [Rhodococcus sp. 2H158]